MLSVLYAPRELWCWVPRQRYDLETLMKCVCKVLIYYPPKTQHPIMIWRCCSRSWILWGCALHEVKHKHSWMNDFSISNIRMVFRKVKDLIGETCCTLRIVYDLKMHQAQALAAWCTWCSFLLAKQRTEFWDAGTVALDLSFQNHKSARELEQFWLSASHCSVIQSSSLHPCMQRAIFASNTLNEILRHANYRPWA